ncbi:putative Blue copper protein precursor [Tripterygium wilfordii]|uniref:Putative Blue copper protein n=1 Tax=Tripterygium wilfordii TaxID=458696 RepID=A0A7J7DTK2_TRIWF|nr:stellacyanin-like [Tripterygium wilfordii]KAF5749623.1 putative Blue copper protein precursor [Tripterygium wilfordii]
MVASRVVCMIGCLILVAAMVHGATAATYDLDWKIPPNNSSDYYEDWVSNRTFQIGDSVVFNWNGTDTAADVPEFYYDNCTDFGTILVNSGVMVTFKVNGTFYYISTIDTHCEQGQKIRFVVGDGEFDVNETGAAAPPPLAFLGGFSLIISSLAVLFFTNYM